MRFLVLVALIAIAGCVEHSSPGNPSMSEVERCSAEAGLKARSDAARSAGSKATTWATPQELVQMNQCLAQQPITLRPVGGIPHTVETKMTGPTTMIETHTYGTPPPAKTANKPMTSSASRGCTYALVGGASYVCKPN